MMGISYQKKRQTPKSKLYFADFLHEPQSVVSSAQCRLFQQKCGNYAQKVEKVM